MTRMHPPTSRLRALLAATAVAIAGLGPTIASPTPAGAAPKASEALFFASPTSSSLVAVVGARRATLTTFPTATLLAGHFTRSSTAQAFLYNPGAGPDGLVTLDDDGTDLTASFTPVKVSATYRPFVLDADQDGHDDIFWYGQRSYLWRFQADGTHTSLEMSVDRGLQPLPFEIVGAPGTPTAAAVLWYGPGARKDQLWRFTLPAGSFTRVPLTVKGTYRPVVGTFYRKSRTTTPQQILWYAPDGGSSSIWNFAVAGTAHTSDPLPSPGPGFQPSAGPSDAPHEIVYWYRPGPGAEKYTIWQNPDLAPPVAQTGVAGPINGTYRSLVAAGGRRPAGGPTFLAGSSAKQVQLDAESWPTLFEVTPIPGLPTDPIGAATPYVAPT